MTNKLSPSESLLRSQYEPAAFEPFYAEHLDSTVVYMARRVYDLEAALDLAAETLAQAFLGRHRFRGTSDADAEKWLAGIARNQLRLYFRRCKVEQRGLRRLGLEPPRLSGEEEQARLIELAGLRDLRDAVRVGLQSVSAEQRLALELRIVEELPYPEVAARLGVSQPAARARVARGLKSLASALDRYGPTLKENLT